MRSDYPLYGLAIVLFALSAIFFFTITEAEGQLLYVLSTALVGLLSIGTGYMSRPRKQASASLQPATLEPQLPIVEPPKQDLAVEQPVVESAKVENPVEVAPPPQGLPAIAAQKVEMPALETSTVPVPQLTEPVSTSPPIELPPELTPSTVNELTRIRGINQNRSEQLKANGIGSILELANASADDLAAKLDVSPKIVKMWIGSAKKLSK